MGGKGRGTAYTADGFKICWACRVPKKPTTANFSCKTSRHPNGALQEWDGLARLCKLCAATDARRRRTRARSLNGRESPPVLSRYLDDGRKQCRMCARPFPATTAYFYARRALRSTGRLQSADGLSSECIACKAAHDRASRQRQKTDLAFGERERARYQRNARARALRGVAAIVRLCAREWSTVDHSLTSDDIYGRRRIVPLVLARDAAVRLVRARYGRRFSFDELGQMFDRDHSSLVDANARARRRMRRDGVYRDKMEAVRIALLAEKGRRVTVRQRVKSSPRGASPLAVYWRRRERQRAHEREMGVAS